MKLLLLIISFCFIANYATAQKNSKSGTTELIEEPASKQRRASTSVAKPSNQNAAAYQFLGLDPTSATPQQYAAAKEKLHTEQPEKYEEFKVIVQKGQIQNAKTVVTRKDYESLPANRKSYIDNNPQVYQIVD